VALTFDDGPISARLDTLLKVFGARLWYQSRATSLAAVGSLIDSLRARGYVRDLLR
jgi:hypothetical protein